MNWTNIENFLTTAGVDLLRGLLVLTVGFFLVHWILKLLNKKDRFVKIEPTLKSFLKNLIRIILYILIIVIAATTMGIPMTSIITLVASAGVAVSLAMQGVLTNLIGGVILLVFKPIRAGEYVRVGDNEGTVLSVGTFYTELNTFDNKHVNLPNGSITNTAIINFSREGTRRLDLTFSVSYDSSLDQVYEVLNRVIKAQSAVLQNPAPSVNLAAMGNSSLDFSVKVWVKSADYWTVNFALLDQGKRALDEAGISIPYPQMDIHMKS